MLDSRLMVHEPSRNALSADAAVASGALLDPAGGLLGADEDDTPASGRSRQWSTGCPGSGYALRAGRTC